MSRETVDTVRRLYEAFNERDQGVPAELLDPDVIWDTSALDLPGLTGVYHGRAGVRRFWLTWFEAFVDLTFDVLEYIDAGDAVVAVTRARGRGRRSGIEIDRQFGLIAELRDGRVVRFAGFNEKADALQAVGLPRR